MCECTVGVDVRDGTTILLTSILPCVVMRCIVLERQMNVDFSISNCTNTIHFVGMNVRFCTMKIHDSMVHCKQPMTTEATIEIKKMVVPSRTSTPMAHSHMKKKSKATMVVIIKQTILRNKERRFFSILNFLQ